VLPLSQTGMAGDGYIHPVLRDTAASISEWRLPSVRGFRLHLR
jgi:hypothetical protein